jgi:hypothetical protein
MLRKSILAAFMLCGVALPAYAESGIASVYQPSDPDGGGPLAANGELINTDDLTVSKTHSASDIFRSGTRRDRYSARLRAQCTRYLNRRVQHHDRPLSTLTR